MGVFLADGRIYPYQEIGQAAEHYNIAMRGERPPWLPTED
jgi:hypothetical protein